MPKFANTTAWQQAELLMQPVFIRLLDNIRKQLERSAWKGSYQNVQVWDESIADETKARVAQLQQQLEVAVPEQAVAIERDLAQLPCPYPGYQLCLKHQNQQVDVDLWQLCYQICFLNYRPASGGAESETVEVDTSLIDQEGEVDWLRLDVKAGQVVKQVFENLSKLEN